MSDWMSFCIESQGRGHGNDPPGTSLTQQKQQSLSPALLLQALTAQSPLVDPCWPHMQATCDAELFVPPPVPLSSCGRIQPAEQTARTGEKSQVNTGSLRFTSFPLTEVVYSFYFNSSRRAGKEKSCSDWLSTTLVQLVKTISTLGTWNWSPLKTLHCSPPTGRGDISGAGKQELGRAELTSPSPCRQFEARARQAWSLEGNLLPAAKGLLNWQGAPRSVKPGHPEIQLHTLCNSFPSMIVRFIFTLWRKKTISFSL